MVLFAFSYTLRPANTKILDALNAIDQLETLEESLFTGYTLQIIECLTAILFSDIQTFQTFYSCAAIMNVSLLFPNVYWVNLGVWIGNSDFLHRILEMAKPEQTILQPPLLLNYFIKYLVRQVYRFHT